MLLEIKTYKESMKRKGKHMEIEKYSNENKEEIKKINKFLANIGMNKTYSGYKYWIIATLYVLSLMKKNIYSNIKMEEIYYIVAEKTNSNRNRVERSMRFAVEKSDYIKRMNLTTRLSNRMFLYKCTEIFLEY